MHAYQGIYIYVCIYHSFPNLLYRKSERLIGRKNNKSPTKHHWKLIHIWYKRITQMTQSCLCFTAFGDHPTYQLNYFPYGINFHHFYKWIILLNDSHKFINSWPYLYIRLGIWTLSQGRGHLWCGCNQSGSLKTWPSWMY